MTEGRLGMIVCPMLEDEAVYNIETDPEKKKVYLVKTPYTETIIPKLRQHGVEYTEVEQNDVLAGSIPKDGYSVVIWVMFMGLHADPAMLNMEVCSQIVSMMNSVDSILLYYGRCGRGLDNIDSWVKDNHLPIPVSIFRNDDGSICDDCICIPVGGTDRYLNLLRKHPGKIYLTPAMAGNFEGFLYSMELFNGIDTTNTEIMKMLLDMAGYTTAMKVQTGMGDQIDFQKNIDAFSEKYDLKIEDLEDGWTTNALTDRNYADAKKTMDGHTAKMIA